MTQEGVKKTRGHGPFPVKISWKREEEMSMSGIRSPRWSELLAPALLHPLEKPVFSPLEGDNRMKREKRLRRKPRQPDRTQQRNVLSGSRERDRSRKH